MRYPYDDRYHPAFPAMQVVLYNGEEGLSTSKVVALLDTGSDASLVPIPYLRRILVPALDEVRVRSHWGEWHSAQLFAVDLSG